MEDESDSNTNCTRRTWNDPHKIGKGNERLENKRTNIDHQNSALFRSSRILRRVLET